jgi:dipeptidyl aminopeptidase/acylaminoacyl peptidase
MERLKMQFLSLRKIYCNGWILLAFVFLGLTLQQSFAQTIVEDYQRAERFLSGNIRHEVFIANVKPNWIDKTNRFWYRRIGPEGIDYILVDADKNTSAPAFDQEKLAAALAQASKHEYKAKELDLEDLRFDGEKSFHFTMAKNSWTCAIPDYHCSQDPAENPDEKLSPDKKWAAYVQDHNLFVRYVSTGEVIQLTNDGVKSYDYATPLPSLRLLVEQGTDDPKQPAEVFWSPDSSRLITYRIDSRNSGRFTSLQFVPPDQLRPKAYTYVYPLPGEVLAKAWPIIFDIQSGKRIDVKTDPIELPFQEGPGFEWFEDGKNIYYDADDRGFKTKELRIINPETGEQKVVLREHNDDYMDPGETFFHFVHSTGEIFASSERDGWNHLYLYHGDTGQLENQVTSGPWVVDRIEYVDEKNHRVFFRANGREKNEDPYQSHLYSIGFDGKGLTPLTPENANHTVSVSLGGEFFVDNYSRPDLPGESVLRRAKDGSEVRVLEKSDASKLLAMGWKYPEPFKGKATDGTTDLYGLIWRPSNFDSSKKYPIVEQIYTGPQGFFVPKNFDALRLQSMAELGFIVVMVDGRGTLGRSHAFHLFSYRNLGGSFEDHVTMIKEMAEKYPYMDINRVGIYGTSAGGYGAAHAMLVFPDFYKVGVSISGDHDPRLDKAWWNEVYQGYPVQDDYAAQSNVTMAKNLKGHLLLEHGDIDDNVHPVETMRFADALMKANKSFDMLFVPNMYHGENSVYLARRRWDYFVQYLRGVTPPDNFEIKEDRSLMIRER